MTVTKKHIWKDNGSDKKSIYGKIMTVTKKAYMER